MYFLKESAVSYFILLLTNFRNQIKSYLKKKKRRKKKRERKKENNHQSQKAELWVKMVLGYILYLLWKTGYSKSQHSKSFLVYISIFVAEPAFS